MAIDLRVEFQSQSLSIWMCSFLAFPNERGRDLDVSPWKLLNGEYLAWFVVGILGPMRDVRWDMNEVSSADLDDFVAYMLNCSTTQVALNGIPMPVVLPAAGMWRNPNLEEMHVVDVEPELGRNHLAKLDIGSGRVECRRGLPYELV
jgi:hypothetical protein